MPIEELAYRAAQGLKEHLLRTCPGDIVEIRVYGSRGRGDAREDSDLDVLILTRDNEDHVRREALEAVQAVYQALDYPFPISPQVMTQHHFDELLHRERLFARSVMEEGLAI